MYRGRGKFVISNLLYHSKEMGVRFKMDYTDIRGEVVFAHYGWADAAMVSSYRVHELHAQLEYE